MLAHLKRSYNPTHPQKKCKSEFFAEISSNLSIFILHLCLQKILYSTDGKYFSTVQGPLRSSGHRLCLLVWPTVNTVNCQPEGSFFSPHNTQHTIMINSQNLERYTLYTLKNTAWDNTSGDNLLKNRSRANTSSSRLIGDYFKTP